MVKLEKQLKYGDATGVRFAVIVGPDEAAKGVVTVRDLQARTQAVFPRAEAAVEIRKRLVARE